MRCEQCGQAQSGAGDFCRNCGARLPQPTADWAASDRYRADVPEIPEIPAVPDPAPAPPRSGGEISAPPLPIYSPGGTTPGPSPAPPPVHKYAELLAAVQRRLQQAAASTQPSERGRSRHTQEPAADSQREAQTNAYVPEYVAQTSGLYEESPPRDQWAEEQSGSALRPQAPPTARASAQGDSAQIGRACACGCGIMALLMILAVVLSALLSTGR